MLAVLALLSTLCDGAARRTPSRVTQTQRRSVVRQPRVQQAPSNNNAQPQPSSSSSSSSSGQEFTVTVSAYNSVPGQSDSRPFEAAWSNVLVPGMKACAISREMERAPYNFKNGDWLELLIDGQWQRWQIKDKLNSRYRGTIDLWFGGRDTVQAARNFGRRSGIKMRRAS
jgi:hypothetical protein